MADEIAAETRPTGRRDWRWALGLLGKTFITMGLLILAFVAYQLWGTGLEFRASQDALGDDFAEAVAAASNTSPGATAPTESLPGNTSPDTTTIAGSIPAGSIPAESIPAGSVAATTTSLAAVNPVASSRPRAGSVVAALEMPTITGRTLYIVSGVRTSDLKRGIGHFPDTALPGELGNAALAGHRTTYGAPFENLDRLEPGDPIIVETTLGERFVYRVESSEIVRPDQVEVLSQVDDGTARLTLTTCHPKRSTAKRLVVYTRLDVSESSPPRQRGTGQPVVTQPVVTQPAVTQPAVTQPGTTQAAVTTAVPTTVSTAPGQSVNVVDPDAPTPSGGDELSRGWFHDSAAWPHILLWGALLVSIALGGRWAGKRLGRRWLGPVVAAVPFVVVLYFVFQNVNRLLPPGF